MRRMPDALRNATWAAALIVVAALSAYGTRTIMRPEPPDLNVAGDWTLIKAIDTDKVHVAAYMYKRESTTWDPYDVRQNKLIVDAEGSRYEFRWPQGYEYAAAWCELVQERDGSLAIVLFESATVVRVVTFMDRRFVFRPQKDALVAENEFVYEGPSHEGGSGFVIRDVRRTMREKPATTQEWQWTSNTGFQRINHRSAAPPDRPAARTAPSETGGASVDRE